MPLKNFSKAETLQLLKQKGKSFLIEDIYTFTVGDWNNNKQGVLGGIRKAFQAPKVIVRSSAFGEDAQKSSMAGYFSSILNVDPSNAANIEDAVNSVVRSYARTGPVVSRNQVLVQPQTENVKISGVIFTMDLGSNTPYYVINYDEKTGKTNTVTSGVSSQKIAISRFVKKPYNEKWSNLLIAVQEIEAILPGCPLDIEFAIRGDWQVVIFQVRPLAANNDVERGDHQTTEELIRYMKEKFVRFSKRVCHICGDGTIYSDMADWNPAEIIGDRPNTLDYTLYRFLITNNIWHEARASLGYADVYPAELMTSFGHKPYIDVRLSFNSLIPRGIPEHIREKLVNFYLQKLAMHPELEDKVEFDILWTCYDFSIEKNIKVLFDHGFSSVEIDCIVTELKKLTRNIISNREMIFESDLSAADTLAYRRQNTLQGLAGADTSLSELLSGAYYLLHNCRKYGTYPFSRLARIAFVANSLLISLKENKIVDRDFYDSLLLAVQTIAKKFSNDFKDCCNGKLEIDGFFEKYGHLRAGTYDITSLRYEQQPDLFDFSNKAFVGEKSGSKKPFVINSGDEAMLNRALKEANLGIDARELVGFIIKAFEYRELSKFEFTKSLSDSLELLARAGEKLGVTREELCHADFDLLMRFRNPEVSDLQYIRKRITDSIVRHKTEKKWFENLILPSLIKSETDFDYVESYNSRPQFITNKIVRAKTLLINKGPCNSSAEINNKVILIENADPGYDWIFTKDISALVTKYGGVASHMAIRCAEFGLPAIIGCGEAIFNRILQHDEVVIDCKDKKLDFLAPKKLHMRIHG